MIVVVPVFRKIIGPLRVAVLIGLEVKFDGIQADHDQFGAAFVTRNNVTLFAFCVNVNVFATFWTVRGRHLEYLRKINSLCGIVVEYQTKLISFNKSILSGVNLARIEREK